MIRRDGVHQGVTSDLFLFLDQTFERHILRPIDLDQLVSRNGSARVQSDGGADDAFGFGAGAGLRACDA